MLPLALLALLANAAAADPLDKQDDERENPAADGKALVESANAAAVREAVESVLADNRLDLDIRLRSRISVASAGGE